jgi:hypothetical protein
MDLIAQTETPLDDSHPNEVQWYPSPPVKEIPVEKLQHVFEKMKVEDIDPFKETGVKYTTNNKWQSISKEKIKTCTRERIHGVEIRRLPKGHPLAGEFGLFAAKCFSRFDIVGEYTGKIVGDQIGGHYVAVLEDKDYNDSLGIDAEKTGNEMRFINSYLNVDFEPNVIMKTVYVNTYPHIVIVCKKDIEMGDEFLLDYGEEYTKAYITKKQTVIEKNIPTEVAHKALPYCDSTSSSDSEKEE